MCVVYAHEIFRTCNIKTIRTKKIKQQEVRKRQKGRGKKYNEQQHIQITNWIKVKIYSITAKAGIPFLNKHSFYYECSSSLVVCREHYNFFWTQKKKNVHFDYSRHNFVVSSLSLPRAEFIVFYFNFN